MAAINFGDMALLDQLAIRTVPYDVSRRLTIRILLLVARLIAPGDWQPELKGIEATILVELSRRGA